MSNVFGLNPAHFTINRVTAPFFVVDGNQPTILTKAYVGFEVINNSNSGTTYTNLLFSIPSVGTSVSGQNFTIVSPASGQIIIGSLAPGESKVCYFYVSYPANQTPSATFNSILSDNTPNSKSASFTISNRRCISANAGGQSKQTILNQDVLGGLFVDDVLYTVGNAQNNDELDLQVSVSPLFDPTQMVLLSTKIIASSVPNVRVGTTDSLYFRMGNSGNSDSVKVRWTFRIVSPNFTTYLLPYAGSTSGNTNYKYVINSDFGANGVPYTVASPPNALTIKKSSNLSTYLICDTAVFSITLKNNAAFGVTVDSIVDVLPSDFSYISLTNTSDIQSANCYSLPNNGDVGQISFVGGVNAASLTSFFIPAGDSVVLQYKAKVSCSPMPYTNTVVNGYIGSVSFGTDTNRVRVVSSLIFSPIATNDTFSINEDEILNGNLFQNDTTNTNGVNAWSVVTNPTNGTLNINADGTFTYTPNANFNGADTFYYKLCDVDSDCDTAMVVITVNSVNDLPVASDDTYSVDEDGQLTENLSTNDTNSGDGGNTWSVVTNPTNGTLNINADGTFTYTPNANFNGADTFYYKLCDVDSDCDTAMVVITVNSVNDLPVASDDTYSVDEDGQLTENLSTNDTNSGDGGNTWSVVTNPTNGTLNINADGTFTYTPNANFNGADTFYYKLCDVDSDCDTAMVVVTVNPVNDLPVASDDTYSVDEDGQLTENVSTNDTNSGDGGNTWSVVTNPTNGTLNINADGTFTYTPNANFNGADTFYYKLCDVDSDCDTAMVVITVNSVNDLPVANDDTYSVDEDGQLTENVSTNDTNSGDGGNTWSVVTNPTNGTLNINADGTFTYTPNANFNGADTFYYKLCDVDIDCDTAMVVITINPVNDIPVANDDTYSVNEDTILTDSVSTNDVISPDAPNVYSLVSIPNHGIISFTSTGTFTYTPDTNFNGLDTFYYKLCDVDSDCDTAMVVITVNPVNDLPVANDDYYSNGINVTINGYVSTNDQQSPDGNNVWSVVSNPTNGALLFNTRGGFSYVPNTGFSGQDTFYYKLCDGNGDCDTAMVVITISNPQPVTLISNYAKLLENNKVAIVWETTAELGMSNYEIERSKDGVIFETIGNQKAIADNSTSHTYQYNDVFNEKVTQWYYRIKMINSNGTYQYSKVMMVKISNIYNVDVVVKPNPFVDQVSIVFNSIANCKGLVQVIGSNGKKIVQLDQQLFTGENLITIGQLSNLSRGVYYIQIITPNEKVVKKVIKN